MKIFDRRAFPRTAFWACLFFTTALVPTSSRCDESTSYIKAYLAACEAIDCFDVHVEDRSKRTISNIEEVKDIFDESVVRTRLSIDFQSEELRYATQRSTRIANTKATPVFDRKVTELACAFTRNAGFVKDSVHQRSLSVPSISFDQFCNDNSIPFIPAVGLGVQLVFQGDSKLSEQLNVYSNSFSDMRKVSEAGTYLTFIKEREEGDLKHILKISFDRGRLVPVKVLRQTDTGVRINTFSDCETVYAEREGFYFPISVKLTGEYGTIDPETNSTVIYQTTREVQYRWISALDRNMELFDLDKLLNHEDAIDEFLSTPQEHLFSESVLSQSDVD